MSTTAPLQAQAAEPQALSNSTHAGLLLQRKCACGSPTSSLTGECAECRSKKPLQTKLTIGASNDPLEQEADRVAEQVLAASSNPAVRGTPPRIQRFTAQATRQTDSAPASVDHVLAESGKPLGTALRQDMEQRLGHDFSRVRVHSGAAAEQSAQEVNANAYTVGHNVVFGAGQFAPGTDAGRRLIAHELTHVVQQAGTARLPSDQTGSPPSNAAPSNPYLQRDKASPPQSQPSGTCQAATLADQFKPTNTWGGKTWDPQLGITEFGSTSKLAANFGFDACKEGGLWRFHLNKLEVMITSKVQPQGFRTNVASASDTEVTHDKVPTILRDLRPNRKVTFRPGCGNDKYDDKVTTYSVRSTFWNRQFVERHEAFHRKNWEAMYRAELVKAEGKVRSHTVPEKDAADSSSAVAKARTDLDTYLIAAYLDACKAYSPQQESRAYDDGAPMYQKLVDEINARAVKEKWIPAASQGIGSGQLTGPDVIPMSSESQFDPGTTLGSPDLEQPGHHSSDHDAIHRKADASPAGDSSDAWVDKLTNEHGGSKGKLPLNPQVLEWVTALRSGEGKPTEADPESALASNDPSKYPERRHEGEAVVWGGADRRAIDPSDVRQGYLGDCYFMALLAAIAEVRPEAIEQMVKPNTDGTFTVSFFGPDGKRVQQIVEPTFPSYTSGDPAYAKFGDQSEVYGKEIWPMLIEKAWMQANGSWLDIEGGKFNTEEKKQKQARTVTGGAREDLPLPGKLSDEALFDRLSQHFLAKQPVTIFSHKATDESEKKSLKTGVITNHTYALWNVHPAGKTADLYNPHGPQSDHLLAKTMAFLRSNFRNILFFKLKGVGLNTTKEGPTKEEQVGSEADPKQILKDSGYVLLVAEFEKQLPITTTHLTARDTVQEFGAKLWEHSKGRAQDPKTANTDDRPLYWARLAATAFVRSFVPTSYKLTPMEKQSLLDVLEASSRGRTSIDFAAATVGGSRRILVSGFDPFGLRGGDLRKANPSGAAVLALDGQTVPAAAGGANGRVEGVIFPVRFADFDRGIVETTFRPYLTDRARRVDMIMTISQGGSALDTAAKEAKQSEAFELERYAGRRRAPSGSDNVDVDPVGPAGLKEGKRLGKGPEFLESSLPRKAMSGREEIAAESEREETPTGEAKAGSGGGFLSNEIFYRTALLRASEKSSVPVGHLHVPYQPAPDGSGKSEKEHTTLRDTIVAWVKKLIANALKSMGRKE
jgi:pyrrolidone-carboxylate peptidase